MSEIEKLINALEHVRARIKVAMEKLSVGETDAAVAELEQAKADFQAAADTFARELSES